MAVLKLSPSETHKVQPTKRRRKHHPQNPKLKQQHHHPSSWDQIKNLLKCKQMDVTHVTGSGQKTHQDPVRNPNGYSKLSSCSSICSFKDVANGNTKVGHRADNSPESSTGGQDSGLLRRKKQLSKSSSSSSSSGGTRSLTGSGRSNGHGGYASASRGMQLRKLSGCYECHAIVDPARSATPRSTICLCSECGEVFPKVESLEHHQAVKHAVSELGLEDSGRNIVEIIFKSSWQNKDHPIFTIERILKINNTRRTIQRFEEYRDAVKTRATATATRCAADGNELLRFHCTTLGCPLGSHGSSSLCGSIPGCGVCTVIRHGFQTPKAGDGVRKGVCTTASSGRAHDSLARGARELRAMLVCRVIAGKVKRVEDNAPVDDGGAYDSISGHPGSYSNIEELYVYNPRAILPCFVVIYKAMES
ncbi:putative transcription factor C2H2 family [Helianthus annuus]|nr:putative transcription factor C2H2 family [Helianthus annuus]